MKLYILSDVHLEFEKFDPPEVDTDVVILAGDIHVKDKGLHWALEKFTEIPVIYVLGNHEYYGAALPNILEKLKKQALETNVHVLENESVKIGGVTFLCCTLWTDFSLFGDFRVAGLKATQFMADYRQIRLSPTYKRLRPVDTMRIHERSMFWLKEEIQKNRSEKLVIVTHHAPSMLSVPEQYRDDILSAAFASNLDELVADSGAELWVHGHMHIRKDYMIGNTRVICNPKGYPDEAKSNFVLNLVVEI
jgi:Icc-related predicted phosphoesterase